MNLKKENNVQITLKFRWVIWGLITLAYGIKFFHSLSMGVVKDTLILEFGLTETTFVSIGNIFFYIYLVMQIPTGLLVDFYGARIVSSVGTFIAALGIIIFSLANGIELLYVGRGMVGLGTSVIFVSILKIQSTWFRVSEFGTLTGLTCLIGTIGGALAQTPLAILVNLIGWRNAFRLIGLISIIVSFLIFFIVRNKPSDYNMPSLNINNETTMNSKGIFKGLWRVLINPQTWPIFLLYAGFYGTYVVFMGYYGTSFIAEVFNKTTVEASNYIVLGVVGSALGSLFVGNISDRLKSRKKPLLITGFIYTIIWAFVVFNIDANFNSFLLLPVIFLIGFMSCAYVISWPTVKEVNDPRYVGVSTSVANIGGFFGTVVLPPLVAGTIEKHEGILNASNLYSKAFTIVLIASIIAFISSLFVKETGCKNIYIKTGGKNESNN